MARTAQRLTLVLLTSLAAAAQPAPSPGFVSVLIPLSFDDRCWSTATVRNLTARSVNLAVEAHDSTGALLALDLSPTSPLHLAPSDGLTLRLGSQETGDAMAWVKFIEPNAPPSGPTVAVSGLTNCSDGTTLTTIPAGIAYPTQNPWIEARSADAQGKMVLLLNAAPTPATARACYSTGTFVTLPTSPDAPPAERLVCSQTRSLYLPPFALRLIPVEQDSSSLLHVTTRGSSLVLLILKPRPGKTRKFSVDSTISFQDPAGN